MSFKDASATGVSRRSILAGMAGTAAASLGGGAQAAGKARPNILWLVSEDNNPFIGAYGDGLAHTPTLDALARRGVLYEHFYSSAPVCAPSRFSILTGIAPESCAPANHMRAQARLPEAFRTYPELMRAAGYHCTNNAKTDYNCTVDPEAIWDVQGRDAHWRSRAPGQPFLAVFNHETTHESQIFHPTPGRMTPDRVRLPAYLPDTPAIRQDFASYYNLMEKMDGQIAARLRELDEAGLADDTIIFYYSDNGGVLPRSKRYCYDEGLRCALIVHVPDKWKHLAPGRPGSRIADPASFVDLAPTLLSIADAPVPAQMQGRALFGHRRSQPSAYAFGMRNRMDERYDFVRTVTDGRWRYIRNYMPHRPWGQNQGFEWHAKGYQSWEAAFLAGTLNPVQARFFGPKPFEELYDLRADPDEVRNLAEDPAHSARRRKLSDTLDAHMRAINDNGFLPEGMAGEGYFESRDRSVYPLDALMTLAALAAGHDPAHRDTLVAALSHRNPAMRYWGAAGLLMAGSPPAGPELAQVAVADPVLQVRIAAAEALGGARALGLLAPFLTTDADWRLQLQALNAVTFLSGERSALLPQIRLLAESEQEYVRNAARYLVAQLTGTYRPDVPIMDLERMMQRVNADPAQRKALGK